MTTVARAAIAALCSVPAGHRYVDPASTLPLAAAILSCAKAIPAQLHQTKQLLRTALAHGLATQYGKACMCTGTPQQTAARQHADQLWVVMHNGYAAFEGTVHDGIKPSSCASTMLTKGRRTPTSWAAAEEAKMHHPHVVACVCARACSALRDLTWLYTRTPQESTECNKPQRTFPCMQCHVT
jgi:hypothetical protein